MINLLKYFFVLIFNITFIVRKFCSITYIMGTQELGWVLFKINPTGIFVFLSPNIGVSNDWLEGGMCGPLLSRLWIYILFVTFLLLSRVSVGLTWTVLPPHILSKFFGSTVSRPRFKRQRLSEIYSRWKSDVRTDHYRRILPKKSIAATTEIYNCSKQIDEFWHAKNWWYDL